MTDISITFVSEFLLRLENGSIKYIWKTKMSRILKKLKKDPLEARTKIEPNLYIFLLFIANKVILVVRLKSSRSYGSNLLRDMDTTKDSWNYHRLSCFSYRIFSTQILRNLVKPMHAQNGIIIVIPSIHRLL